MSSRSRVSGLNMAATASGDTVLKDGLYNVRDITTSFPHFLNLGVAPEESTTFVLVLCRKCILRKPARCNDQVILELDFDNPA